MPTTAHLFACEVYVCKYQPYSFIIIILFWCKMVLCICFTKNERRRNVRRRQVNAHYDHWQQQTLGARLRAHITWRPAGQGKQLLLKDFRIRSVDVGYFSWHDSINFFFKSGFFLWQRQYNGSKTAHRDWLWHTRWRVSTLRCVKEGVVDCLPNNWSNESINYCPLSNFVYSSI